MICFTKISSTTYTGTVNVNGTVYSLTLGKDTGENWTLEIDGITYNGTSSCTNINITFENVEFDGVQKTVTVDASNCCGSSSSSNSSSNNGNECSSAPMLTAGVESDPYTLIRITEESPPEQWFEFPNPSGLYSITIDVSVNTGTATSVILTTYNGECGSQTQQMNEFIPGVSAYCFSNSLMTGPCYAMITTDFGQITFTITYNTGACPP